MSKSKQAGPITDLLRQTIIESGMPMKALARETGVQRLSIMRFVRGVQSLRLDVADKLAAYFGLALVRTTKKQLLRKDKSQ
jgi:plasmid maintenance system antidote protein VapI